MRTRLFIAVALFVSMAGPAHSAPTLSNGDFSVCSGQDAGSWTEINVNALGGCNSGGFVLNSNGTAATNPTITQAIGGLVVGNQYRLTGSYRGFFFGGTAVKELGVEIDDDISLFDLPDTVVRTFQVDFTFDNLGLGSLLRLTGERTGDVAPLHDNIAIVELQAPAPPPSSVPEPSALLVLAPFASLLVGAGWRRSRSAA